jgi:hypothetical protein
VEAKLKLIIQAFWETGDNKPHSSCVRPSASAEGTLRLTLSSEKKQEKKNS